MLGSFCVVDTRTRTWTDRDVTVLRTLAEAASGEVALRAAAERSTVLARTLQEALLPPITPDVPGLDVGAAYRAAGAGTEVVGDFHDVFESAGGRWNAVLVDYPLAQQMAADGSVAVARERRASSKSRRANQ